MICRIESKHGGGNNARPWVVFVNLLNVKRADEISYILVNAFYGCSRPWVTSCVRTALKSVLFAKNIGKFYHEFCATIEDDLLC